MKGDEAVRGAGCRSDGVLTAVVVNGWMRMDGCEEEWAPEVNGVKGRLQKCAQTVTTDSSREENTIGLRRWRRNLIGWTERVNEVIVEEAGEKRILFNPTTHLHPLWTVLFFILRQLS